MEAPQNSYVSSKWYIQDLFQLIWEQIIHMLKFEDINIKKKLQEKVTIEKLRHP